MQRFPQIMVNIDTNDPVHVITHAAVVEAARDIEASLAGRGRVLIRPSGTEPVVRIMVEGEHADAVRAHAEALASVVRQANGA